jgi:hypothetical protein
MKTICVRNRFYLWISVLATAIFWYALYEVIKNNIFVPKRPTENSFDRIFEMIYPIVAYGFFLAAGPISMARYTRKILVDDNAILITWLFGLVQRRYRINDIVSIETRVSDKSKICRLKFRDGFQVGVEYASENFDELIVFLESKGNAMVFI